MSNNNNNTNIPKVPRGNVLRISVVLTEKTVANGVLTDAPVNIGSLSSVKLVSANGQTSAITENGVGTSFERIGARFVFTFPGTLKNGKYTVEIAGKKASGDDFRWKRRELFAVVEYTDSSNVPTDLAIAFAVDGSIGVIGGVPGEGGIYNQVQADWDDDEPESKAYIKHKPSIPDVSGKADKVSGATSGNFAALDGNGNITDSGHKPSDYYTKSQTYDKDTIDGKIAQAGGSGGDENVIETVKVNGTALTPDESKAVDITVPDVPSWALSQNKPSYKAIEVGALPSSTQIPVVTGKADKVSGATNGNFAALDGNGNLTDSGHKPSDYYTKAETEDAIAQAGGGGGGTSAEEMGIIGKTGTGVSINSSGAATISATKNRLYYLEDGIKSVAMTFPAPTTGKAGEFVLRFKTASSGLASPFFSFYDSGNDPVSNVKYPYDFVINANTEYEVAILYDGTSYLVRACAYQ